MDLGDFTFSGLAEESPKNSSWTSCHLYIGARTGVKCETIRQEVRRQRLDGLVGLNLLWHHKHISWTWKWTQQSKKALPCMQYCFFCRILVETCRNYFVLSWLIAVQSNCGICLSLSHLRQEEMLSFVPISGDCRAALVYWNCRRLHSDVWTVQLWISSLPTSDHPENTSPELALTATSLLHGRPKASQSWGATAPAPLNSSCMSLSKVRDVHKGQDLLCCWVSVCQIMNGSKILIFHLCQKEATMTTCKEEWGPICCPELLVNSMWCSCCPGHGHSPRTLPFFSSP